MKLYVSDIDGTLLRNNATLSPFSKEQLNILISGGVQFTVASARSVAAMQKILHGVNFKLPIIEFNGAFISDIHTGKHHIINSIEQELVQDIFSLLENVQVGYFVSSFNGKEDCLYYSDSVNVNEGTKWYYNDRTKANDRRLRYRRVLTEISNENIVCFTIIDSKDNLQELYELVNQRYGDRVEIHFFENQYSPGWYWLTIHHWRSTKDQAIQQILDQYGFSKEQLTVFGDQTNDIKMFQFAANAIAVGNAAEELKKYATKVIGTNEEDSVIKYIIEEKAGRQIDG